MTSVADPPENGAASRPLNLPLSAIIVDDEPANRDFLVRLIQQAGYTSHGAEKSTAALELLSTLDTPPTVMMVDNQLPDMNGTELVQKIREAHPNIRIVMATMYDERSKIREAFAAGADAFLVKPHGFMELFSRLKMLETDPENLKGLVFDKYGVRQFS